jgi:hypothetical protein
MSVPKSRVICRPREVQRCDLSRFVSSGICLTFVSFLRCRIWGHFGMLCSSVCAPSRKDGIASRDSDGSRRCITAEDGRRTETRCSAHPFPVELPGNRTRCIKRLDLRKSSDPVRESTRNDARRPAVTPTSVDGINTRTHAVFGNSANPRTEGAERDIRRCLGCDRTPPPRFKLRSQRVHHLSEFRVDDRGSQPPR